jgi:hypothetical protein
MGVICKEKMKELNGKNPSERTDGKTHTKRECYGE